MKPERLASLVADLRPNDLSAEENVAYELAYKLVRGSVLPEPLYRLAVETFGQHATNEMIYHVRRDAALRRTAENRPDLVTRLVMAAPGLLDARDRAVLAEAGFTVDGEDMAH